MRWFRAWLVRLLGSFSGARRDRELVDELENHLQLHIEDNIRAGMSRDEARRHAILVLGGIEQTRERWRDQRGIPLIEQALQDLRYALRILRNAPGFTAMVVLILGLGIGATTTVFGVIEAVLLRPLPFAEPERLAMLRLSSGSRLSSAYLYEWRRHAALSDLAGWHDGRMNLTGLGEPLEVQVDHVTPNFFTLLGARPVVGRTFMLRSDLSQADSEVVLSHGLWQRAFGGEESVIGRSIVLDGESFTIVGVMPPGFTIRTNELSRSRAELWIPLPLGPGVPAGIGGFLNVVARLAPGADFDDAQAELASITRRIESEYPSYRPDWRLIVLPLHDATVADVRLTLLMLFGCVGILLVIGCVNVAGLLLSRGAARQTEVALRMALGATTGRLVRQFLTESAVLAVAGGVLGILLATWGTTAVTSIMPAGLELPTVGEIRIDTRALVFAVLAMALTMLLSGLFPSLAAARWSWPSSLQDATRSGSPGRKRVRSIAALVTVEIALAALLLSAAGLLARTFQNLTRVDPGFRPEAVLTMRTKLSPSRYTSDDRVRSYGAELLALIGHVNGVRAAGLVNYLPLSNYGEGAWFDIAGRPQRPKEGRPGSATMVVGGSYFESMGIPLIRGRLPGPPDTERTEPVFVIDEALARQYWPGEDPLGARLTFERGSARNVSGTVIGVVGSVRWAAIAANPPGTTYFWFPQEPTRDIAIAARVTGDPSAMAKTLAAKVREVDPDQPIVEIRTMQAFVSDNLAQPRVSTLLTGSFAAAALLLSMMGVYGVVTLGVMQRRREFAVRAALGAQRHHILRLVMVRGALLVGTGVVIGLAAALIVGRVAAGLLYGVTPRDTVTFVAVTVLVATTGMLATYLPASRATRADPMTALRAE